MVTPSGTQRAAECGTIGADPAHWICGHENGTSQFGSWHRQRRHHLRGLYYYHLVMARALDAFSERPFVTADGREHDWPAELAEEFLKTVRESRLWKNDNPAWYEGDPVLVTSYVLNTCDILFKYLR